MVDTVPAYVDRRPVRRLSWAGLARLKLPPLSPYFLTCMGPRNRFQGMNSASLCSLAGRYDNPLPPRFLAPIDSLKIPALITIQSFEKIHQNPALKRWATLFCEIGIVHLMHKAKDYTMRKKYFKIAQPSQINLRFKYRVSSKKSGQKHYNIERLDW